jgi:hypothetical protein
MRAVLFLLIAVLAGAFRCEADVMTYPDLVDRLTDLQHLATPPPAGERTELASSYDRHSVYDAARDKYIGWDANSDGDCGGDALATHDAEGRLVMADIHGPGCIWRTWTATVGPGHVKIYLDGAATPTIDLPWSSYFDGKHGPFTRPNLVYHTGPADSGEASGGWDNYTPISFAKSCRIVAEKGWGFYYHFNYTRFAPGTDVSTFALPLSVADDAALDAANAKLGRSGVDPAGPRAGEQTQRVSVTLLPGKEAILAELPGEGAITGLRIKFDAGQMPADLEAQRRFCRELAVRMTWDGEMEPAVWTPLGDFFGSGYGAAVHLNLPSGLTADGTWYSYWYMPFARGARIALDNDGDHSISLHAEIVHASLAQPASSLLRFHAKWHRDVFLPTRADRAIDWTMLTTEGRGRFVGTQLHIWSPCNGWWGEGDEKFFVDGEKFPSTFGTGSEDYFGYAWGRWELFARPFHSQTTDEDMSRGNISVNRWHISDNVPFQTSFEGDIEKYYPNNRPSLYANTTFWYLSPGGRDPYRPVPVTERVGYWAGPFVYHEPDSVECESMKIVGAPRHAPRVEDMTAVTEELRHYDGDRNWGGNAQLFWPAQAVGERLDLGFEIPQSHLYQLMLHMTMGPGNGIVEVGVDGGHWSDPIDLYAPRVVPGGSGFHPLHLEKGDHVLSIRVTGSNPAATGCACGLDWLKKILVY